MKSQVFLRQYFDDWAKEFTDLPNGESYHLTEVAKEIRSRLPLREKLTILDLGIGNARIESALNLPNTDYIGLDISSGQLKVASSELKGGCSSARLIEGDLEEGIPLEDQSVDVIISNASIHHVKNKASLFEECSRVLKAGGKLIFFDFYFGVLTEEHLEYIAKLSELSPEKALKFRESIRKEHLLMPKDLEATHPAEYHVNPQKLISVMKGVGFTDCQVIPTFYDQYLGMEAKKL